MVGLLRYRVIRRALAAAVLSLCGSHVGAQSDGWSGGWNLRSEYAANQSQAARVTAEVLNKIRSDSIKASRQVQSVTGGVDVTEPRRWPGAGGSQIEVQLAQKLARRKIIEGVAASIPLVGTAITAGMLLKDIIDASRAAEGYGGGLVMDRGQPEVQQSLWSGSTNISGQSQVCTSDTSTGVIECLDGKVKTLDFCNQSACYQHRVRYVSNQSPTFVVATKEQRIATKKSDGTLNPWGSWANGVQHNVSLGNVMACPPGQVISFWADDWCTTAPPEWDPATPQEVADRIETRVDDTDLPEVVRELDEIDAPVEAEQPRVTGPAEIHRGRETTVNPDGSTTVKDTYSPYRYGTYPGPNGQMAPGYEWGEREETRTYPPGVPIPAPGGDTSEGAPGPITETEPGADGATGEDPITCGLPWTPPCKIDERGTAEADADTSQADAQSLFAPLTSCFQNLAGCLPELPSVSWTFALPSSCSVIPVPAFADIAPSLAALDVCQFQPVFHDVMAMVWALAGLVGAIRLVFSDAVGG